MLYWCHNRFMIDWSCVQDSESNTWTFEVIQTLRIFIFFIHEIPGNTSNILPINESMNLSNYIDLKNNERNKVCPILEVDKCLIWLQRYFLIFRQKFCYWINPLSYTLTISTWILFAGFQLWWIFFKNYIILQKYHHIYCKKVNRKGGKKSNWFYFILRVWIDR